MTRPVDRNSTVARGVGPRLLVAALCSLPLGCEEPPVERAPSEEHVEAFDEELREHAEIPPPPSSAWPDDVEGLSSSVARFESREACLAELRARTPTGIAEGLADLSYDSFFDDVCRGLEAAHHADASLCDEIEVRTARAGCRRRVALLAGTPDACPEDVVIEGREPVCLAWAARQPGLCRAAASGDEARCRAVLEDDPRRCARLRAGDRLRCEAEVRRYAQAIAGEREEPSTEEAVFRLEVTVDDAEPTLIERDVLRRGVRLEAEGCRYRVALQRASGERGTPPLPGRFEPTFHLRFETAPQPGSIPLGSSQAVLHLALPELGTLSSGPGSQGGVEVTRFEARRGGGLEGTIGGTILVGDARVRLEGRFATFVRDLDALPSRCTPAATAPD